MRSSYTAGERPYFARLRYLTEMWSVLKTETDFDDKAQRLHSPSCGKVGLADEIQVRAIGCPDRKGSPRP